MAKIETTTKKLKQGITVRHDAEIHWESTGHLSVQLLDASGNVPLAGRTVQITIPGEGTLSFETDASGKVFHPDVPFQDYELQLGGGLKVHVPAVANTSEVHERHVVEHVFGFARFHVRDPDGFPLGPGELTLTSPDAVSSVSVDDDGLVNHREPLPSTDYDLKLEVGDQRYVGKISLINRLRDLVVVTLTKEGA